MLPIPDLLTRHLRGMNSDLMITLRPRSNGPEDRAAADAALDACATWLGAFESTCSRFRPDSEICALNASTGAPVRPSFIASPDLFAIVRLAMRYRERTGGLFDPTILPALRAAGYTRSFDQIAHREIGLGNASARGETTEDTEITETRRNAEIAEADAEVAEEWDSARAKFEDERVAAGGVSSAGPGEYCLPRRTVAGEPVQLDDATHSITLAPGVALDLGGIAKGWAADELARRFLAPFPAYLIDLGGDLRVQGGPRDGEPWILGIADPRPDATDASPADRYVAGLSITSGGVATSGDARRWWLHGDARQHHLIDPRTGHPAEQQAIDRDRRVLTYTALAPTTAEADVMAKVAFLLGYPDGLRLLDRGDSCAGVAVLASGRVEASPNLEEYLHALPLRSVPTRSAAAS